MRFFLLYLPSGLMACLPLRAEPDLFFGFFLRGDRAVCCLSRLREEYLRLASSLLEPRW